MASNQPVVATQITQHTLWTALSGEVPPLSLRPAPISRAVLDSRDAGHGDLFIALSGQNSDGHTYLAAALANGACAAIAEERGRAAALDAGAAVVDCTRGRWALNASLPAAYHSEQPLVYLVDNSALALQQVGAFQPVSYTHLDVYKRQLCYNAAAYHLPRPPNLRTR